MRSMTGFGQAAGENERFRVEVALRAVNHRFLDLAFRLRDEVRAHEPELRSLLAERLHRGRVEVAVEVGALASRAVEVTVDEGLVAALHRAGAALAERGLVRDGLTMGDLLRLPEVVRLDLREAEWRDEDAALLREVAARAADRLVAAREVEGRHLQEVLGERLRGLEAVERELRELATAQPAAQAAALRGRLDALLAAAGAAALDPERLAQEVAVLADRSDVTEELDRLRSHLRQIAGVLAGDGEPLPGAAEAASRDDGAGKRLDFLVQELVRELNTVGSKCRDAEMTRQVVAGKVLCEQLREQVQNVE